MFLGLHLWIFLKNISTELWWNADCYLFLLYNICGNSKEREGFLGNSFWLGYMVVDIALLGFLAPYARIGRPLAWQAFLEAWHVVVKLYLAGELFKVILVWVPK